LPQAIGLFLGENWGISVDLSYRLARLSALAAVIFILYFAFLLYPVQPFVLALIALPMTLFQISSATIDGISMALAILSICTYLNVVKKRADAKGWIFYCLWIAVAILLTSRVHLLSMPGLVFFTCRSFASKWKYYLAAGLTIFVLTWHFIALRNTVDLRVNISAPTS
jgi:uncharacterized membrane protein